MIVSSFIFGFVYILYKYYTYDVLFKYVAKHFQNSIFCCRETSGIDLNSIITNPILTKCFLLNFIK